MKRTTTGIYGLSLCLAAVTLAGCGGTSTSGGSAQVVDGGTFTLAMSSDPGNLDPQMGAGTTLFTVSQFAALDASKPRSTVGGTTTSSPR